MIEVSRGNDNCEFEGLSYLLLHYNLNHSSDDNILNLPHCKLSYRLITRWEGKSGQHRAPHPANGWTSLKKKEIVPQKITASLRGKGENVR